jgi:hypothetical protein
MVGLLGMSSLAFAGDGIKKMEREERRFEKATGVELHIPRGDESTRKTTKKPVDFKLAKRAIPIIMEVLLQYPEVIRGGLLTDLNLYGKLRRKEKGFLGQAKPKTNTIDLAIRNGTRPSALKRTTHHEVSHLIEMHPKFPAEKWKQISAESYGTHQGKETKGESFRHDGFVSRYASKNRHEDFAELAELAFTNPEKAQRLAEKYPEIGTKLRIMTRVYKKVAPEMTLPWLEGMERSKARSG